MTPRPAVDIQLIQRINPGDVHERYEGIGFSTSGDLLGVATSDGNAVLLFGQRADGSFSDQPFHRIDGLDYPHDVAFSRCDEGELLAVAQRSGVIAIFVLSREGETVIVRRVFEIKGRSSKLAFSDGVAFVPPFDDYIAAVNLTAGTVSFFRRTSLSPIRFEMAPDFELRHRTMVHPDGLAFSKCGQWLATANHGANSVSVFQRRRRFPSSRVAFGPEPVTVIADQRLICPHSIAFTPQGDRLIVTNAGANYVLGFEPVASHSARRWLGSPTLQHMVGADDAFRQVNMDNKAEGGPKGIAVHGNSLAICSPQIGINIYALKE